MRKLNYLFFALFLTVCFSCQDKDDLNQSGLIGGNTVLSLDEYEFTCTGGEIELAFTANESWELAGCPDWLNVSKKSGRTGTTTIKMSVDCNETRELREAKIYFNAKDGSFKTPMKIVQPFPYLNISTDTLHFNWNDCRNDRANSNNENVAIAKNPQNIEIQSNVRWKIKQWPEVKVLSVDLQDYLGFSHFAISAKEGKDDYTLSVIPNSDNFYKEPYDVQLKLYSVYTDKNGKEVEISSAAADSYIIKLHQRNLKFLLDESAADATVKFSELNDDPDINIEIDTEIPWKVKSCPSWVKMNKEVAEAGKVTVNFLADGANPAREERTGVIILTNDADAERVINVSQDPYVYLLENNDSQTSDKYNVTIGNDDTSSAFKKTLTTTGTWEIDQASVPGWLTVEPMKCEETTPASGKSAHEIILTANNQNLEFNNRTATIKVKSTMNDLSFDIPVSQDMFIFDINPDSMLANLPTMDTDAHMINVNSSGPWEITEAPDEWLSVSMDSAAQKGTYEVSVNAMDGNPNEDEDRITSITFTSLAHRNAGQEYSKTVNVKQSKFIFNVAQTGKTVNIPAYKADLNALFNTAIECSAGWEITECPDWITPSATSDDPSKARALNFNVSFTPEMNLDKNSSREGKIVITSVYNDSTREFEVCQDAFVFGNSAVLNDNVVVMNNQSYPVSFDLTAEAQWELTYDEWLSPSAKSGNGNSSIIFIPQPNPNTTERTGTATVKCTVNGEEKVITFVQEKYEFEVTSEPSYSYTELDKSSDEIQIHSSGQWEVVGAPEWVELSAKTGNSDNNNVDSEITIKAKENVETSDRNADFTIQSSLNPDLKKQISISQAAFKFNSESHSFKYETLEERTDQVQVVSSGPWTVSGRPDWIEMDEDKLTGLGNEDGSPETITITSTVNLTDSDRNATIQIISDKNPSLVKKIAVSQSKFVFEVGETDVVYTSPLDETTKSVEVECTADWTVKSNQSWLNVKKDGDRIAITPEKNVTTKDRSAIITAISTKNDWTREITVSQPKFIFEVDKTSHIFGSAIASENNPLTVGVNCSEKWTVETDVDWLTLSATGGNGDGSFKVTPSSDNLTANPRSGNVIVKSTLNEELKAVINVSQSQFDFDVSTTSHSFSTPVASTPLSVNVTCSDAWAVSTDADWLTLSPSSGRGNGTLKITPSDNLTENDRSATVTVTSTKTGWTKTIKVSQPKFTFSVDKTSHSFSSPIASDNNPLTVTVTCSGKWTVEADVNWLTLTSSSGTGNGTFKITPADNTATTPRSGKVTVKSSMNGWTKTINITQAKAEPAPAPEE